MKRMSRRSKAIIVMLPLLVGLFKATSAEATLVFSKPVSKVCRASYFKVGVRYLSGKSRSYSVRTYDPAGRLVLSKTGTASSSWRFFSYRPTRTGRYLTRYTAYGQKASYATYSVLCGTVVVGDNDAGAAMFAMNNLRPGSGTTSCLSVAYAGTLQARMRLYGLTGGTGLDEYLHVTVTRGVLGSTTPAGSCDGFTPDATSYIGSGPGVMYAGTLRNFPDGYLTGVGDPKSATPETWTRGESHAYRITARLPDTTPNGAQGKAATQSFIWEARGF